ncbi:uroporphyrinogen-III synthase [Zunongwangia sp.]|uniref:uroporphyrinogen-III synthase n=1 Tax=Zunongwangia sp. TaxID=1965325 RepID=UPI003AA91FF2
MATVLSTKKLTTAQQQLLLNAKIGFVQYNAISIEFLPFLSNIDFVEHAIFTSKNAFKAIQGKVSIKSAFVVGNKTALLLQQNNIEVAEMADNALELAEKIIENHQHKHFLFFCGNKRRDELPSELTKNKVSFEERTVYKTNLNYTKFQQDFNGILFFNPSGIKSYFKKNKKTDSIAFCIGTTTANAIKKYTTNIKIATKPSIENVLVQVVKTFNKNKLSNF